MKKEKAEKAEKQARVGLCFSAMLRYLRSCSQIGRRQTAAPARVASVCPVWMSTSRLPPPTDPTLFGQSA